MHIRMQFPNSIFSTVVDNIRDFCTVLFMLITLWILLHMYIFHQLPGNLEHKVYGTEGFFTVTTFWNFFLPFLNNSFFWGDNIIISSLHFLSFLLALPWYLLPLALFQIHSPSPVYQLLRMCVYIHISKYISTYSVYIMFLQYVFLGVTIL